MSILKAVDARAVRGAIWDWRRRNSRFPSDLCDFEVILKSITVDDLSPDHRAQLTKHPLATETF